MHFSKAKKRLLNEEREGERHMANVTREHESCIKEAGTLRRLLTTVRRMTIDRKKVEYDNFTLSGITFTGDRIELQAETFRSNTEYGITLVYGGLANGQWKAAEVTRRKKVGIIDSYEASFRLPEEFWGIGIEEAVDAHLITWTLQNGAEKVAMSTFDRRERGIRWSEWMNEKYGGSIQTFLEMKVPGSMGFSVLFSHADLEKLGRYLLRDESGRIAEPENYESYS